MANARTDDAEAASCQLKTSPAAADIPTSHSVALQGLSAEPSAAHERATTTSIFDELVPGCDSGELDDDTRAKLDYLLRTVLSDVPNSRMDCSTKTNEANRRAVLRILDQLLFNTPNGQPFCRPSRVAIVTPFEAQNQLYRAAVFLSLVHNIDPRHMPRVHTVDSIAGCSVYFLIVDIVITSTEEAYRFLE